MVIIVEMVNRKYMGPFGFCPVAFPIGGIVTVIGLGRFLHNAAKKAFVEWPKRSWEILRMMCKMSIVLLVDLD